jgi:hypothetical protein
MGAKRAIYFGPPDRPNRGFFYGPSYESIWTNDFHYKACVDHERNYFQFDGEGNSVGRPQTLLMRNWRVEMEKQAKEHHVAARLNSSSRHATAPSRIVTSPLQSPLPSPYLKNCSPDICPPAFRPAGAKRFSLSPEKPPLPPKEFERELWDSTHTRIMYLKTAKPSVKPSSCHAAPSTLPLIASPAVSPQKAQQQVNEQQQQLRAKQVSIQSDKESRSELLTRDGRPRRDYVSEVSCWEHTDAIATYTRLLFCSFACLFRIAGEGSYAAYGRAAVARRNNQVYAPCICGSKNSAVFDTSVTQNRTCGISCL